MERSRKYIDLYMDGLIETKDVEGADVLLIASGSAAAQSREAIRMCQDKGIQAGLILGVKDDHAAIQQVRHFNVVGLNGQRSIDYPAGKHATAGRRCPGHEAIGSSPRNVPGPAVAVKHRTPARDPPAMADMTPYSSSPR